MVVVISLSFTRTADSYSLYQQWSVALLAKTNPWFKDSLVALLALLVQSIASPDRTWLAFATDSRTDVGEKLTFALGAQSTHACAGLAPICDDWLPSA
jgi:hypothetical protein